MKLLNYYNNSMNIHINIYIYIPGEQFLLYWGFTVITLWIKGYQNISKQDHFSTIKPVMLTQQPNQRQKGTHNLIPKNYGAEGAICTHTPTLRGSLLPWGSQNLTARILNFAARSCFCSVSIDLLLPTPYALAISSCNYVMHLKSAPFWDPEQRR
jgi:hypothetical protein